MEKTKLLRKATSIFGLKLIGTFLLLCTSILMNRLVGFEEFGHYVFVMGFVNLLVVLVCFGGDTYLKRAVATSSTDGCDTLNSSVATILAIVKQLVVLWVVSLIFIGVFFNFSFDQKDEFLSISIVLTSLLVLGLSLAKLVTGVLIGFSMPVHDAAISSFFKPVLSIVTIMIPLAIFGGDLGLTYRALLGVQVVAVVGTICLAVSLLMNQMGLTRNGEKNSLVNVERAESDGFTVLMRHCFPLALVSSAVVLERNIDILMLGYLDSSDSSALYFVCTRISALFLLPLFVLNSIVTPVIARSYKNRNFTVVEKDARKVSRLASSFSMIVIIFTALVGDKILGLFGEEYVSAFVPMMLLCVGNLIRTLIGPAQMVAIMFDMDKEVSRINIFSLFLNICLNMLLIPFFGIFGAVYATVISRLWRSSFLALKLHQRHSVRVGYLFPKWFLEK